MGAGESTLDSSSRQVGTFTGQGCSVCGLDNPEEKCSSKRCGHVYCTKCVLVALAKNRRCPRCKEELSPYSTVDANTGEPLWKATAVSPYGHTFCQLGRIGYASYHFTPTRCFISFDSSFSSAYSDGSKVDGQVDFEEWVYRDETRTFTAFVRWGSSKNPRTLRGACKTEFSFRFDEGFEFIESGCVQWKGPNGSVLLEEQFGSSLFYRRVHSSVYPSSVYLPENVDVSQNWLVELFARAYTYVMCKLFDVPPWAPWELLMHSTPIMNVGFFSIHLNAGEGSYVDISNLPNLPQHLGGTVPIIQESFDEATRCLEFAADFKSQVVHYKAYLDETLEFITGGTITTFVVMRARGRTDFLSQKYETALPQQILKLSETCFGTLAEPSDPQHKFRFRLASPWQIAQTARRLRGRPLL